MRQGLLFVWGESSRDAVAESAATTPPLSTYRERIKGALMQQAPLFLSSVEDSNKLVILVQMSMSWYTTSM